MPEEVLEEQQRKWQRFYDGSWVRDWRRLNGYETPPTRDELADVIDP
jgi:hypothetical protein